MSLRRSVTRMLFVAPLVSTAVAGCSGFGVEEKRRLDEVRQEIANAEREPAIQTHAASFLAIADKTLQEARAADDPSEVRHLIYLAQRRLEIARSVARLKLAAAQLESSPTDSRKSAGFPGHSAGQKKRLGGKTGHGKNAPDRLTAAKHDAGTADPSLTATAAPVPPRRPKTGQTTEKSKPEPERRPGVEREERTWSVLPMESLFADAELSRVAPTVGQELAPLVRFLRENEGSIVLIKGSLVKDKPTEKELAWSIHAAEAIKAHLVEADIESSRIFTIGRIEKASAPEKETAEKQLPAGQIEIALFDGGSLPSR